MKKLRRVHSPQSAQNKRWVLPEHPVERNRTRVGLIESHRPVGADAEAQPIDGDLRRGLTDRHRRCRAFYRRRPRDDLFAGGQCVGCAGSQHQRRQQRCTRAPTPVNGCYGNHSRVIRPQAKGRRCAYTLREVALSSRALIRDEHHDSGTRIGGHLPFGQANLDRQVI
jgi:hypothetical protein